MKDEFTDSILTFDNELARLNQVFDFLLFNEGELTVRDMLTVNSQVKTFEYLFKKFYLISVIYETSEEEGLNACSLMEDYLKSVATTVAQYKKLLTETLT